jgi:hypothetical protein
LVGAGASEFEANTTWSELAVVSFGGRQRVPGVAASTFLLVAKQKSHRRRPGSLNGLSAYGAKQTSAAVLNVCYSSR